MPAAIYYSHRLVEQQAKVRKKKNSPLPWLRPDAESAGDACATRTARRSPSMPWCCPPSTIRRSSRRI
ncbi:MAG: hypothetical protein V9G29_13885 [Burkholderiaceae bacterium]